MKMIRKVAVTILGLAAVLLTAAHSQAEPALWMVKGPHATVYLFGTVHLLKEGETWRSPKIDAAIGKSQSLWLEIPNVDDAQSIQPLVMKLGVDQAHPLSSRLSKEQLGKLDAFAKSAGIPAGEAALEPLRPWLAAITLSTLPMAQAGFDPKSGVENVLKPEFVNAGKPVKGFETAEEQLHFFADMPDDQQVEYLVSSLDELQGAAEKLRKIVGAWNAGDEAALDQMFSGEFRDKYPDLYKALIVQRNQNFASRIDGLLKGNGTAMVAVGAGHLVGKDGVPALLRSMGYEVERQ